MVRHADFPSHLADNVTSIWLFLIHLSERPDKGNNVGNNDIGLIYMNARFYVPGVNRFLSADSIVPDPTNPQSYNRYSYVLNRSLTRIDPTGRCDVDHGQYQDCLSLKNVLEETYDVRITGKWWLNELELMQEAFELVIQSFTNSGLVADDASEAFLGIVSDLKLNRIRTHNDVGRAWTRSKNRIDFYEGTFLDTMILPDGSITHPTRDASNVHETFVHELAHVWDRRSGRDLSEGLRDVVSGQYEYKFLFFEWGEYTVSDLSPYRGGSPNPPNHGEDWAYTFAAFVVDQSSLSNLNSDDLRSPYISEQINNLVDNN